MTGGYVASLSLALMTNVSILTLLALGLAVVFGMRGIINLAHGEFVMVGAYLALVQIHHKVPLPLAVIGSACAVGLLGALVERVLIRWLYHRLVDCMLATWGLSLLLTQAVVLIFGTTTQGVDLPLGSLTFGGYTVAAYSLVLIGTAVAALVTIAVLMRSTSVGLLARATARSSSMAAGLGVNTSRIDTWTFAFGSALAGLAGGVLAPFLGVSPTMGQTFIAKAFMTVIVGGADFIVGIASAAAILGGIENTLSTWITPVIGQVGLLLVAIVIVRFRPAGLTRVVRR